MLVQQIREIIQRDGIAHIAHVTSYGKMRRHENVYLTEITDASIVDGVIVPGRVVGFIFDARREDFKRAIGTKHDGVIFSIGGGSGKRRYYLKNVDPVHVKYLYDVVSCDSLDVAKDRSGCLSKHTFYAMDLNIAQACSLALKLRKSGNPNVWFHEVGDHERESGKGAHWRPDWNQRVKVSYNLQKVVD